jgi:hypothetical protein
VVLINTLTGRYRLSAGKRTFSEVRLEKEIAATCKLTERDRRRNADSAAVKAFTKAWRDTQPPFLGEVGYSSSGTSSIRAKAFHQGRRHKDRFRS